MKILVGIITILIVAAVATLPFHYINADGRFKVIPKANLTFDHTFVNEDDVNKIREQLYSNDAHTRKTIANEPLTKKLRELDYVSYENLSLENENNGDGLNTPEAKKIDQLLHLKAEPGVRIYNIKYGNDCAIDKGVAIIRILNDSISFFLKVTNTNGYSGEIDEKAVISGSKAIFKDNNGCKITFAFPSYEEMTIDVENCRLKYSGEGICFGGVYTLVVR
jgi:hypothetical protein